MNADRYDNTSGQKYHTKRSREETARLELELEERKSGTHASTLRLRKVKSATRSTNSDYRTAATLMSRYRACFRHVSVNILHKSDNKK